MHSQLSKLGKVSPERVLVQSREGARSQQRRCPFKPERELTDEQTGTMKARERERERERERG